ncbi:MAG TPA: GAF domain-containing protein [Anaerolineales bacterium]
MSAKKRLIWIGRLSTSIGFWIYPSQPASRLRSLSPFITLAVFLAMVGGSQQIGIGHVTTIGFAMVTVTAAILIGSGAGIFFALLSTLAHVGIGLLQVSGGVPGALPPTASILADGIGLGLGLVVLIAFTGIYGGEITRALEREKGLRAALQANQTSLEEQVRQRTRDLEARLGQFRATVDINRQLGSVLDPDSLLRQTAQELQTRFGFAGVCIYQAGARLSDNPEPVKPGETLRLRLRAAAGEAPQSLPATGSALATQALALRQARLSTARPGERAELALPVAAGSQALGVISIWLQAAQPFNQDDVTILQSVADSLATALVNARLFHQAQASLQEIQALHRQYLTRVWAETLEREKVLEYTYEDQRKGAPQPAAGSRRPAPDAAIEVPLVLRDQVIGSLSLEAGRESWTQDEQALIEGVAAQAALALENARLLDEARRKAEQEHLSAQIAGQVWASSDVDTILRTTLQELGRSLQAADGRIELEVEA